MCVLESIRWKTKHQTLISRFQECVQFACCQTLPSLRTNKGCHVPGEMMLAITKVQCPLCSGGPGSWLMKKRHFSNLWLFVLWAELGSDWGGVSAGRVLRSVRMVNIGIVNLLGQNSYFCTLKPRLLERAPGPAQVVVKFAPALFLLRTQEPGFVSKRQKAGMVSCCK